MKILTRFNNDSESVFNIPVESIVIDSVTGHVYIKFADKELYPIDLIKVKQIRIEVKE